MHDQFNLKLVIITNKLIQTNQLFNLSYLMSKKKKKILIKLILTSNQKFKSLNQHSLTLIKNCQIFTLLGLHTKHVKLSLKYMVIDKQHD